MTDKEEKIVLELSVKDLQRLRVALKSQLSHLTSKRKRLQEEALETMFRTSRGMGAENSKGIEGIVEFLKEAQKVDNVLEPLQKKFAAVDALLDPATSMWLALEGGSADLYVSQLLEEVLGENIGTTEEPAGGTLDVPGEAPKPKEKEAPKSGASGGPSSLPSSEGFGSFLDEDE